MALDAGTIEGYLDLDISGFLNGLSTAGENLSKTTFDWQKKTDGAGSKIGSKMQKIGAGLTLGLTTPILGAGAAAITMAAQYDSASAKMQSVLGITADEADSLTQVARNIYTSGFGPSFDDVVSTATEVRTILGDLNTVDMDYVTTGVQNLADTMDMDVGESVRGINVLMDNFGLSAQEAMDMFAAGAQNGLNYSDELGDNIAEYGPRLSQMGFSAQQYFQILENGTESGAYNLDKVNDFLNEFQTSLSDGRMDENIGKFSTATQDLFKQWKEGSATGAEVYESVISDLAGMEDGYEKAQLASAMWSSLGEDNAMAMIDAMTTAGDTFDDVAGKSQDMADTASQSLGSQFTSLVRSVQDALADLGASGTGPISSLISMLQGLVDAFQNLSPEAKQVVTVIAMVVAAIGPVLTVVGTVMTQAKRIVSVVSTIKTTISSLSGVFTALSGPVGIVIAIVAALAAAFVYLWNTNEEFRNGVMEVWNQIVAFIQPIIEQLMVMFQTYWPIIQQTVTNVMTQIWNIMQMVWPIIQQIITEVGNAILLFIQTAWPIIQQVIQGVMTTIQTIMQTAWPIIQQIISVVMTAIQAFMDNVWPHIQTLITNVMNVVQTIISTVWGLIQTIFNTYGTQIQNIVSTVFNQIQNVINTVMGVIQGIIDVVTGIISGNWEQVWNGINNIASSVWNGIKTTVQNAINIVSNVIDGALSTISSLWESAWDGISSFLSDAWEGIKSAVSDGIDSVVNFFSDLPGNILSAIGDVGNLLWDAGSSIIDGLLGGLQSAAEGMFGWVGGIADTIASLKGPLPYDRKLLIPAGEAIIGGLKKSMMSSFEDVKDEVSKMGGEIADEFNSDLKPIDYDMKINVPDQKSIDKLKQTAGFMSKIAASQSELDDSKYSYRSDQSFGLNIDYNKLGLVITENLRNAPIQANVDVTMQDGDVYMDSERVGRKVAPVVSRVQVKGSKVRR